MSDARELVTVTSAPDNWVDSPQPRSRFIAGYLDDLIHLYPDVELASIRIHEFDGAVTITGRRGRLADHEPPPAPARPRRLRTCVEAWPDCQEGEYNPYCCRFPKSCSCDIYDPERVTDADLEPAP